MKTLKLFGKIFLIFLGCILGLLIGFEIGSENATSASSIEPAITALMGLPVGGIISLVIYFIVSRWRKKEVE
ncbi:hypothetical protein [Flammeovirga sp. OC4]|uniref:hypothetical protein n=1 Tax=Flammeovirga sp. OC4 TaxID=1382345 RepID=UPI0005C6A220|nr:hypothetical protein [Flammeovirga sp. OC4]